MRLAILIIILVLVLAGFYYWRVRTLQATTYLDIGDKVTYEIEIRDDMIGMARGLSGRESLAEKQGMLFVYSRPQKPLFWMKDMNFPLDFVWIRDFQIVELSENIPHPAINDGKTYSLKPSEQADMVLEINAGNIARYNLEVGDIISIN